MKELEFSIVITDCKRVVENGKRFYEMVYHVSSTNVSQSLYNRFSAYKRNNVRFTVYVHKFVEDVPTEKHVTGLVQQVNSDMEFNRLVVKALQE